MHVANSASRAKSLRQMLKMLPLLLLPAMLNAQVAAPFLRISPNARQVGMGEAFTGMANDYNLLRYNVGGLGLLNKAKLATNFHGWIGESRQGDLEFSVPLFFGVGALGVSYFSHGKFDEFNADFDLTGTQSSGSDVMLSLGYGQLFRPFGWKLAIGAGTKLIRQDVAGVAATGIGVDVGFLYELKTISLGGTFQNFTVSKVKFTDVDELLPETLRGGIAFRIPVGKDLRWNIAADVAKLRREDDVRYYTGTEFAIGKILTLRGGYKIHDFEASRWAAGMGLRVPMEWLANSETEIDYAFSPLDVFDEFAHRFSFTFTFGVLQPRRFGTPIDTEEITRLQKELAEELVAAKEARQRTELAEQRTRTLEEDLVRRLERIQQIALTSAGKIEVVPDEVDSSRIFVNLRIGFDFDKADIRESEFSTMGKVAEILNTYPESGLAISGHTDDVGTDRYNMELSARRMNSVMQYLAEQEGIDQSRFFMPIPYGESRPIASNAAADGRAKNRRVEFILFTKDREPEIPAASLLENVAALSDTAFAILFNGKANFELDDFSSKPRIVLDFPDVYYFGSKSTYELNRGAVIRARIGYHQTPGGRYTRVVFDLNRDVEYAAVARETAVLLYVR